jgi:hypothetical protein
MAYKTKMAFGWRGKNPTADDRTSNLNTYRLLIVNGNLDEISSISEALSQEGLEILS